MAVIGLRCKSASSRGRSARMLTGKRTGVRKYHASRPALERAREERPRDEPGEEEDRIRLVAGRGARGRAEQDAEEDREHHKLQQRDEEVPREPERRALVPRAQLARGEVAEELAALVERG